MKTWPFSWSYKKILKNSFYPGVYLPWGHSLPSLVQFGQHYDLIKQSYFLKTLIWNNRKFPYEKLTFFLRKL